MNAIIEKEMNIFNFIFQRKSQEKASAKVVEVEPEVKLAKKEEPVSPPKQKKTKSKKKTKFGSTEEATTVRAALIDLFTLRLVSLNIDELKNILDHAGVHTPDDQAKMIQYVSNLGLIKKRGKNPSYNVQGSYGNRPPKSSISRSRAIQLWAIKKIGAEAHDYVSPEKLKAMKVIVGQDGELLSSTPDTDTGNLLKASAKTIIGARKDSRSQSFIAFAHMPDCTPGDLQREGSLVSVMTLGEYEERLNSPFLFLESPKFPLEVLFDEKVVSLINQIKDEDLPFEEKRAKITKEVHNMTGEKINSSLSLRVLKKPVEEWTVTPGTWRMGVPSNISPSSFINISDEMRNKTRVGREAHDWSMEEIADFISELGNKNDILSKMKEIDYPGVEDIERKLGGVEPLELMQSQPQKNYSSLKMI
jgi:hypothetical protein